MGAGGRRRRGDRASSPPRTAFGLAALGLAGLLALVACQPKPLVPVGVRAPEAPFVRAPYVQRVERTSALVRWMTEAPGPGRVLYGPAGVEERREAPVEVLEGGGRRAHLEGLPPGSEVEYVVEHPTGRAGPFRFRTAPPDTSSDPVRVLAFGDSGWGSPEQVALARLMEREEWDVILHVGDIAYDYGSETDFTVRHFRVYADLLARVPFYPAPGNHDLMTDGGAPYDRAFDWPGPPDRRWYTFRRGRARFVALDTDSPEAVESLEKAEGEQYDWLVETLRESRDTTLTWTIVYMHHPIYSHGTGLTGHGGEDDLRRTLEPLFLRHGVDVVLAGHEHHYERSRPLRRGEVARRGCAPVYIITGAGGASQFGRDVAGDEHTARVTLQHEFLSLTLRRGSAEGRAVGVTGEVIDRFTLIPYHAESAGDGTCE